MSGGIGRLPQIVPRSGVSAERRNSWEQQPAALCRDAEGSWFQCAPKMASGHSINHVAADVSPRTLKRFSAD
ncbi:MAG: hypothetical protein DME24_10420 [Verrucomicrobia bacterium]|nr:MAG: hypothetical protein DME24_10420 [Verrucomicrobiota bacterium]